MNSQKEQVLKYLQTHGTISSWEAISLFRITRLSEHIRSLRHEDGYTIQGEWKHNAEGKRWILYRLETVKVEQSGQYSLI